MVSGKRVLIFPDRMDRGKWIIQFPGHRNPIKIGQAHICELNPGHWLLQAIDIEEPYWRQGYGTLLMARIREHLLARKATSLHSSNTGSGTVQILSRVFCAEDVRHFAHGEEITGTDRSEGVGERRHRRASISGRTGRRPARRAGLGLLAAALLAACADPSGIAGQSAYTEADALAAQRKFREALDRKKAGSAGGTAHQDGGAKNSKSHGAVGGGRREFRRKSG